MIIGLLIMELQKVIDLFDDSHANLLVAIGIAVLAGIFFSFMGLWIVSTNGIGADLVAFGSFIVAAIFAGEAIFAGFVGIGLSATGN